MKTRIDCLLTSTFTVVVSLWMVTKCGERGYFQCFQLFFVKSSCYLYVSNKPLGIYYVFTHFFYPCLEEGQMVNVLKLCICKKKLASLIYLILLRTSKRQPIHKRTNIILKRLSFFFLRLYISFVINTKGFTLTLPKIYSSHEMQDTIS